MIRVFTDFYLFKRILYIVVTYLIFSLNNYYFIYEHFARYCHVIMFISMVIRLSKIFSFFDIAYCSICGCALRCFN